QLALAAGGRVEARGDVVVRAHFADPRADGVRRAEVERRVRDRDAVGQRQRDLRAVGRRVAVGVDLHELVVSRARRRILAREVEVAVVGEVDDRAQLRVVVVRLVVDGVLPLVVQREGNVDGQLRGVTGAAVRAARAAGGAGGVAVRADELKRDTDLVTGVDQAADLGPNVVTEPD